jgi:hypothetical protein
MILPKKDRRMSVYTCRIHTFLVGVVLASALTSAGCQRFGIGYTHIGELVGSPQKFADQEVRIQGKVTRVFKLPLVAIRLYSVRDETGEIVVRSEREPPLAGATTHVKGLHSQKCN